MRCSSKNYRYCLCINSISLNREHKSRYVIHIVMSVTVLLLGVALVDPLGAMSGFSDNGPYSPIKEALSKVDHPRTLMLASFDDFYAIESNYIARAETSDSFVEKGYKPVLVAASLGEQSFNNYLHRRGVTHIIVPRSSADNGFIFHKWGNIGSINLALSPPFFEKVVSTVGDFPVVLFKVLGEIDESLSDDELNYSIEWDPSVRGEFQLNNGQREVGLNSYSYSYTYVDGEDVSWIFGYHYEGKASDAVRFRIRGNSQSKQKFAVSMSFLAAYGGDAPSQVVRVNTSKTMATANIRGSQPATLNLVIEANENVELNPVLPCRTPSNVRLSFADGTEAKRSIIGCGNSGRDLSFMLGDRWHQGFRRAI